jgi:Asp-tRNA(Asn)/Glu-tRNA(Gln) amidotransferase A subunit family amidase
MYPLPRFGAKGVNELFWQFRACSAGLAGILGPRAMRSALTRAEQERWRATMAAAMRETGLLALATVPFFPPRLEAAIRSGYLALTSPENLAGSPALALPVPTGQQLPASLQTLPEDTWR